MEDVCLRCKKISFDKSRNCMCCGGVLVKEPSWYYTIWGDRKSDEFIKKERENYMFGVPVPEYLPLPLPVEETKITDTYKTKCTPY